MVRPRAPAVVLLMINSKRVGSSTGRSREFALPHGIRRDGYGSCGCFETVAARAAQPADSRKTASRARRSWISLSTSGPGR